MESGRKGEEQFVGKWRFVFIGSVKEERNKTEDRQESKKGNKKKLQVGNYVNQTTCIELQEVITEKVK